MAEKRTDSSKYKSPSTGDYCTASQYIAELMCQRMAENSNEGSLAYKFWNTEKWKNKFRSQVTKAYSLLKKYDDVAIINALKSPAGKRIYSLRLKNLETLIQKEQKQIDVQNSQVAPPKEYNSDGSNAPRKPYGKKSNAQKLRELDG